ncbi:MAG: glycosyltransferase family 2 protein [Gemmatimonadota bacterium]|nr:MAG: glycosyltransferase family 2 protein [Gemmatimonadota bacterium]
MELSVVVPLFNEEDSVEPLVQAVRMALPQTDDWELVLVDDGSSDATVEIAMRSARADARVRLVRLARNYGQTPAMQAGFDQARGRVIVTMDGDLQNDPADIPNLLAKLEEGYDLVTGYRLRRQDKLITRKLPSWIANRIIAGITGVKIRDNGCSLKAYRRELLDRLHLYSDMHRFIPAVAAATAGARIAEIPVRHHPRRHGVSKYGLSRVAKVLADLLTIKMIRSFRERPLALFAVFALGAAVLGAFFVVASLVAVATFQPSKANAIVFPGVALLWFGLSFYLLMLGLIGEVALREYRESDMKQLLPVVREEKW